MAYIPEIVIQDVVAGNTFGGVATDGTLAAVTKGAPYWNGRVNYYENGTDGGLYTAPPDVGTHIGQIMFSGAGTTGFSLAIRSALWPAVTPITLDYTLFDDTSLVDVQGKALATTESFIYAPSSLIFVPPSHSLVFTTTGALTGTGRIMFVVGGGWGYRTLQNIFS
jgi:hypothetical protein